MGFRCGIVGLPNVGRVAVPDDRLETLARIEAEISLLPTPQDKAEFLQSLGLDETGLARVIRAGDQLLDLVTDFTVGPKEARAWTVPAGTPAPRAAGGHPHRLRADVHSG